MTIVVGSDHAGFTHKEALKSMLVDQGYTVVDVGAFSADRVDYPDFGVAAARLIAHGVADYGVLVCGSGIGISIAANKIDGIRAVNAHDPDEAEMSRRHNDANVLTLAGRRLVPADAAPIVQRFLATDFEGGRHERRVEEIAAVERGEEL